MTTHSSILAWAQSCPTLCDPMNCSTPGLPVHHQLPEFTQTHPVWQALAGHKRRIPLAVVLPRPAIGAGIKKLSAKKEAVARSLGREDTLEKEIVTHNHS